MNLFSKMKEKVRHHHGLVMILCCAIPIILIIIVLPIFGFSNTTLSWLILLLCPLMHFILMRDMKGSGCHGKHTPTDEGDKRNKNINK